MTEADDRWRQSLLPPTATLEDAIRNLNEFGMRLVLCVRDDGTLFGTITDGDLRRGLLRDLSMQDPVSEIANPNPLVVPESTDREIVRALMVANKVQQVPVIDARGRPIGLHLWDAIDAPRQRDNLMVIMAGGKGTRLRPHTGSCPKPMLPVAGKPILQHIVERARAQGFDRFVLTLNYLGNLIRDHFGDGTGFGVDISYIEETEPLGTAGALSLMSPRPDQNFVVTNGDVLTDIDYGKLLDFQSSHGAAAAMAVRIHEWTNPFGVVRMDGANIVGFEEKPITRSHINAGIYALKPLALEYLERQESCDMPTLFDRLRQEGRATVAYPMHEPWLDVGRPDDLDLAKRNLVGNAGT